MSKLPARLQFLPPPSDATTSPPPQAPDLAFYWASEMPRSSSASALASCPGPRTRLGPVTDSDHCGARAQAEESLEQMRELARQQFEEAARVARSFGDATREAVREGSEQLRKSVREGADASSVDGLTAR